MESIAQSLDALLGPKGAKPQTLAKLRTTHHELARLLALGLKDVDISRATGYTQNRICILKKDPMFAELVSHYSAQRDASAVDMSARLRALALTSVEVMQERLEDDPDSMTMKELSTLAELGLDRTGFGKTTKVETSGTLTLQTLDQIKASIEKEHKGRVLPRNHRAEASDVIEGTAIVHSQTTSPQGVQGQGD